MRRSRVLRMVEIGRLQAHLVQSVGEVLARAFDGDPLCRFLFPDPAQRLPRLGLYYTALVRYGMLAGEVFTATLASAPGSPPFDLVTSAAGVTVVGAAIWFPNAGRPDPVTRAGHLQESGLLEAPTFLGADAFGRLLKVVDRLERRRREAVPGPHWHLGQLGVDPGRRRLGAGGALLRPALEQAAAAGWPAYLETFNDENLPFYRGAGFQVIAEEVEPTSRLPFWICLRSGAS